jgi:hypothetical protein
VKKPSATQKKPGPLEKPSFLKKAIKAKRVAKKASLEVPQKEKKDADKAKAGQGSSDELPGPLVGKKVRIVSEKAGNQCYAWECTVQKHSNGFVHVFEVGLGKQVISEDYVQDLSDVQAATLFPPFPTLKRVDKHHILMSMGLLELEEGEVDALELLDKQEMILDQHIVGGLELLQWAFTDQPTISEIKFADPLFIECWSRHDEEPDAETPQMMSKFEVVFARLREAKLLLIPIFSVFPAHWTLLTVQKQGGVEEIKFFDSLLAFSEPAREKAARVLKLFSDQPLPPKWNSSFQHGATCGFWVLSYAEESMRCFLGQGRAAQKCGHSANAEKFRKRMKTLTLQLSAELKKTSDEKEKQVAAVEKAKKSEQHKKGYQAKVQELKKVEEELAALAKQLQGENKSFSVEDLSKAEKLNIAQLKTSGAGVCGSCRWQSGCLRCDWKKRFEYVRKKEEPLWLQGRKKEAENALALQNQKDKGAAEKAVAL